MKVGIAGGGLIGSLLAWRSARAGATIEVFDAGPGRRCATAAAGLLSPTAELATASPATSQLGRESILLWTEWLAELDLANALVQRGSLLTALGPDVAELERLAQAIAAKMADPHQALIPLDSDALAALEPELGHLAKAYHLPGEGSLDSDAVLAGLHRALDAENITWHCDTTVDHVGPHQLRAGTVTHRYDWACDCRGLGAAAQLDLRPVRGEIIHLHAPDVNITRPVRLAHPRYPVYVVPRRDGHYLVGATEIESGDPGSLSVRSALELLSAAYSLHPGFAEAQLHEARTGLRPAFADNEPQLSTAPGLISINGMYRHGFLAGPALVAKASTCMGLAA